MKTSDFYYDLPQELIAQTPVEPRDSSRLLVYNRSTKTVEHKHFYDVTNYLQKGDVLVVNNTKVLPARIYGKKEGTGGKVEFLLLKRLDLTLREGTSREYVRNSRVVILTSCLRACPSLEVWVRMLVRRVSSMVLRTRRCLLIFLV